MKQNNWDYIETTGMSYLTTPKDYSWITGATLMILLVIAIVLSIN